MGPGWTNIMARNLVSTMLLLMIAQAGGGCLSGSKPVCLEDVEEAEAMDKLYYVLDKYEEAGLKIAGEPIGVHGKRVAESDMEELHIVFQLVDHTIHDVIQTCAFVVTARQNDECETIATWCNTFLPITPRPLLERSMLLVCPDGVKQVESDIEETEADVLEPELPGVDELDQRQSSESPEEEAVNNKATAKLNANRWRV